MTYFFAAIVHSANPTFVPSLSEIGDLSCITLLPGSPWVCLVGTCVDFCCYWLVFQHSHFIDIQLRSTINANDHMISDNTMYSCFIFYLTLRNHQVQVQGHAHQEQPDGGGIPLNINQYRKTASSALWLQIILLVCYLPYGIAAIFVTTGLRTQFLDLEFELQLCLFTLNSTLIPLFYCWKIKEIRQAVMDTFRRCSCFSMSLPR